MLKKQAQNEQIFTQKQAQILFSSKLSKMVMKFDKKQSAIRKSVKNKQILI